MQDLRFALRTIARSPSYAAMVVGSLAIGIAAPVLAFSIVNVAVLRPLEGVPDQDRLVRVGLMGQRGERWVMGATHGLYVSLRDELRPLATMAAAVPSNFVISREGQEATTVNGELVSDNYFDTLGVVPAAGRFLGPDDARARERLVVIGYEIWRRVFALDPAIVGQFMLVNGTPLQIVGVAPERFHGFTGEGTWLWVPFHLADIALRRQGKPSSIELAGPLSFEYVGRLRDGVQPRQVEAAAVPLVYRAADGARDRTDGADRLSQQMLKTFGPSPAGAQVTEFWRNGPAPTWYELTAWLGAAMALPFLVLAIACINAGNLVLARATSTMHVWNLQLALGASRARLLRQPIVEGLLLAVPAAAGGLLLTRAGFQLVERFVPFDLLIDWRVVAFAFATACATPLLFGAGPVWRVLSRARRQMPGQLLRQTPRSRLRTALLVTQAGLSMALLGTGTQWVRTVQDGFGDALGPGDRMLVASLDVDKLQWSRDQTDAYYASVLQRVQAIPGASRAGLLSGVTDLSGGLPREGQASLWLGDDAPDKPRSGLIAYVTSDMFATLGVPVTNGRPFTPDEHRGPLRTVIVNEPFVKRHLGGNPIGSRIRLLPHDRERATDPYAEAQDVVVVGVVREPAVPRTDTLPMVFAPVPAVHLPARTLYVPFGDPAAMAAATPAVRDAIRAADARVPYSLMSLADRRWQRSEPRRFMAIAITVLGALALVLAAAGLYGAVSYAVALRTREIGVRMAVGATAGSVLRSVIAECLKIAALGSALGTAGAVAVAVTLRSRMYGTSAIDPVAFGATIAILLATMFLASLVPAARAARVDPSVALRAE